MTKRQRSTTPVQDTTPVHTYTLTFKQRLTGQRADFQAFYLPNKAGILRVQDSVGVDVNGVQLTCARIHARGEGNDPTLVTFVSPTGKGRVWTEAAHFTQLTAGSTTFHARMDLQGNMVITSDVSLFASVKAVQGSAPLHVVTTVKTAGSLADTLRLELELRAMTMRYEAAIAAQSTSKQTS